MNNRHSVRFINIYGPAHLCGAALDGPTFLVSISSYSIMSLRMIVADVLWRLSIQTMLFFAIFLKLNLLGFASRSALN